LILLVPLMALALIGERFIEIRLSQLRTAAESAKIIHKVWSTANDVNRSVAIKPQSKQLWEGARHPDFLSVDEASAIQENWEIVIGETTASEKALSLAHKIILKLARKSRLDSAYSDFNPEYSSILLDRIPEVSYRIDLLVRFGENLQNKPSLNQMDEMAFIVNAGQFKSAADNISRVSHLPLGSFDATSLAHTANLGNTYRRMSNEFQRSAVSTIRSIEEYRAGAQVDLLELQNIEIRFDDAINSLWIGVSDILNSRLEKELNNLELTTNSFRIGLALFGISLILAVFFLRKSILSQAQQLETAYETAELNNHTLEQLKHSAEYQAHHDPLTGLPNRRYLQKEVDERLAVVQSSGVGIAIVHIDLDHFKQINDTLGHGAGDYVLQHVSTLLRKSTRKSDFISRVGGDEFVILVNSKGEKKPLVSLSNRIIDELSKPIFFEGDICQFGASIGIEIRAANDDQGVSVDASRLLTNADIALYQAKEKGRGRYQFFSDELRTSMEHRKVLADELMAAIRDEQIYPVYQPQINARTGAIVGVEALARWRRPNGEILSPGVFFPIADRMGVTAKIDSLILEKALTDFATWDQSGFKLPNLSTNVSSQRLSEVGLITSIKSLAVPVERMSFELLESILFDNMDDTMRHNLDALEELGIAIEIDDFGTGHSSLMSLQSLSPSRLKIARDLTVKLTTSKAHQKMVACIIDIADNFGISVIAEGIESEDQRDILLELGCENQQGYLFSAPLPAEELSEFWFGKKAATGIRN
ncbi:MAG: EAL domain-containing protein, partial [Roseibium sp.]|uniref:putative bifunctional diguanylate cyclase/phosphodiesterase n=1 Tax=Roseibium sp. TaxID=1936156 RepID=UPI0026336E60